MECQSHYLDQLFRESERMYKRKTGTPMSICRTTLDLFPGQEGHTYLEMKVRSGPSLLHTVHCINEKWSIERNAWEIGQAVATKFNKGKVLY
jgi:hypothetical protein